MVIFLLRLHERLFEGRRSPFQDFGLHVEAFARMVGDCPAAFFNLAVSCCNVSARCLWWERTVSRGGRPCVTPSSVISDERGEAALLRRHRGGIGSHERRGREASRTR